MAEKKETRGRKRLSHMKRKPPQATLKINDFILPFVKELKGNLKKGLVTEKTLEQLFFVLQGAVFNVADDIGELKHRVSVLETENRVLKDQLDEQKKRSLQIVLERDVEHQEAMKIEGRYCALELQYRNLKDRCDALLHQEHDCMAITADRKRCSKKAVIDITREGLVFHVCLQHGKVFDAI